MSKFKVGQEVRVVKLTRENERKRYIGQSGVIISIGTWIDREFIYNVEFNDGNTDWLFKDEELELAQQQPSHPLVLSRDTLNAKILGYIESIQQTFQYKNNNYGSSDDPFFNFRSAASNVLGEESAKNIYKSLQIYIQKHLAALYKNGLSDPEFIERCKDIIVYTLISMAMKETFDKENSPV